MIVHAVVEFENKTNSDRMFQLLSYLKQYPRRRQIVSTLHSNDKTVPRVHQRIRKDMEILSAAVTDVTCKKDGIDERVLITGVQDLISLQILLLMHQ